MTAELPFEGFDELVRRPLAHSDPVSFGRIKGALLDLPSPRANAFSYLLKRIVGRSLKEHEARSFWGRILAHKSGMESRLGRIISIQVAAVDFFELQDARNSRPSKPGFADTKRGPDPIDEAADEWMHRIYAPNYHIERLRHEMARSRRYNHAMSLIMLDIDAFHTINERFSYQKGDAVLGLVVKIVRNTIRAVDVIARYSGDRFLVILPDTNRREAIELADRLRTIVSERTKHVDGLPEGVTVSLSAGQFVKGDTPADLLRKLESALESGKAKGRNAVYQI